MGSGDFSAKPSRRLWATQHPLAAAAFSEPAGPAAWQTIPSWNLLPTQDNTIPPKTQAYVAEPAGATITRVRSSHVAMQSQPEETTNLILRAAKSVE